MKKIIVCEDEKGIVELIKIVLEDKGYEVVVVPDSVHFFELYNTNKPDLVLLDLWMPEVTGEEIAVKLKSDVNTKQTPIVIISADRQIKKISKKVNANGYLEKPFEINQLESLVDKLLFPTQTK